MANTVFRTSSRHSKFTFRMNHLGHRCRANKKRQTGLTTENLNPGIYPSYVSKDSWSKKNSIHHGLVGIPREHVRGCGRVECPCLLAQFLRSDSRGGFFRVSDSGAPIAIPGNEDLFVDVVVGAVYVSEIYGSLMNGQTYPFLVESETLWK